MVLNFQENDGLNGGLRLGEVGARPERMRGRGGRVADASLPQWPAFDVGPVGRVGDQTSSNWISQDIGPLLPEVVIASDAMIEATLLPPDWMKVGDLPLEGSEYGTDTRAVGNTREDMDVVWHGQEEQRRPTTGGTQMFSGLYLRGPSFCFRELVQAAWLSAKRKEDGVIGIDPSWTSVMQPTAQGAFHARRERARATDSNQEIP